MSTVNDKIIDITKRLSHAYISDHNTANILAVAVVCRVREGNRPCMACSDCMKAQKNIHPDIIFVTKQDDKRNILVDQIRELKQDIYILPNDSMQKAYVINNAETMNPNAQNALLRILEEPPAHAVFILSTSSPSALLPTIRSRCIEVSDFLLSQRNESESDSSGTDSKVTELSKEFIEAIGDNVKLIEIMFRLDKLDRIAFESFIHETRKLILVEFKVNPGSLQDKILHIDSLFNEAEEMLNLNVSVGHISGMLCSALISS